jgi:hypothetical protein
MTPRERTACLAVVDGAMIVTEAGTIVYENLSVPPVPMPGGAFLRTVNQRLVQDRTIDYEAVGRDRFGNLVARVWVDGESVNARIARELARVKR